VRDSGERPALLPQAVAGPAFIEELLHGGPEHRYKGVFIDAGRLTGVVADGLRKQVLDA
jgi:hypothetical protein